MGVAEGLLFRRMLSEDLDQILAIQEDLAFQAWSRESFLVEINDLNHSLPYVLTDSEFGRIVAYAVCKIVGDEAELCSLAVVRERQRQGYARALLFKSVADLQERGVNAIFLEVRINNAPAQSLYQDCGFYVLGLRRRYYPDGSDALAMVKRMDLE